MIYSLTVPQFIKCLKNLSTFLDKSAAYADHKKFDFEVLLQSRLAPDQFPLVRQLQITCDTAKFGAARLANKEAPSHPDTEKTLSEVKARIESVIAYLKTFKAQDFAESAARKIILPRTEGKHLSGEEYVIHYCLPNFYFHLTTAYSILRHNGVDLGKMDFLGELPLKS